MEQERLVAINTNETTAIETDKPCQMSLSYQSIIPLLEYCAGTHTLLIGYLQTAESFTVPSMIAEALIDHTYAGAVASHQGQQEAG